MPVDNLLHRQRNIPGAILKCRQVGVPIIPDVNARPRSGCPLADQFINGKGNRRQAVLSCNVILGMKLAFHLGFAPGCLGGVDQMVAQGPG